VAIRDILLLMATGLSTVLSAGEIYDIRSDGETARCTVVNRDDVDPAVGARCAAELERVLSREVLSRSSMLTGVVLDVRRGPAVFGPQTRASLERLFSQAERSGKRIVARVGTTAIQQLQFRSLCQDHAPTCGRIALTDEDELWVSHGGDGAEAAST
jgi:hypothetical protein